MVSIFNPFSDSADSGSLGDDSDGPVVWLVRWVALYGDRRLLALVTTVVILSALLMVGTLWEFEMERLVTETRAVQTLFNTLLGGIILFVSVVLSINTAALAQEFAPLQVKLARIEDSIEFQIELEELVDEGVSPAGLQPFLEYVIGAIHAQTEAVRSPEDSTGDSPSSTGQERISELFTSTAGRGTASVVGVLALVWSALKLFRGLDLAFEEINADGGDPSLLEQLRDGAIVFLAVGAAVAMVVGVAIALARLQLDIPFLAPLSLAALVVGLVVAFLPVYYVLPPVDISVREALPGAALAAVGWVVLQIGFRIYARNAGRYAAYGLIGSALLFVTWLYFASIVVFPGAAVNAVRRTAEQP